MFEGIILIYFQVIEASVVSYYRKAIYLILFWFYGHQNSFDQLLVCIDAQCSTFLLVAEGKWA